ncbi:MAG: ABC transporter permease [Treponema sp.]|nr:ABC transporter permease [Candidatus Treponema caballi]
MWKFIIKRVLLSILILFFVGLIIYGIMRCMPTSFIEQKAMALSQRPGSKPYAEWIEQLSAAYGFDSGIISGFFKWLKGAIRFDFGESWFFNQLVTKKFSSVIWYSFALGLASFILEIFISIPLGIKAARKQYSGTDYAITVFALIGISLPSFFFATILKYIFSVKLNWFDLFGVVSRDHLQMTPTQQFLDIAKHYILPTITLTICSVGSLMRFTRANMLEVLNSDYIRTARAKGVSEKRVINYHAFRNILIPIITLLGGTLPGLFSGAMITETLFQIPGIGYTSYQAVMQGDIPFVMFYMIFSAVLILLGNLISDILYAVVDPRVRVN